MTVRPAFKIHGGKRYLCQWIISHFPPDYENMEYLEPYCGAASVLVNKKRSINEVINDIDPGVVAIFNALRLESKDFISRIKRLKYTEETFKKALAKKDTAFTEPLDYAINEFVLRRMSRDGQKKHFSWSERQRGGQPGDVNAWQTAVQTLPQLAERLKSVFILNKPGVEVIRTFSGDNTLVYADPPYLHDTRVSKAVYEYEMTPKQHEELADALIAFRGKVLLSGYPSPLYNRLYKGWNCVQKTIANHSSQMKTKQRMTEAVWKNF